MTRPLLVALAVFAALAAVPVSAQAAPPCRDRIYNQWYASGKISTNYPVACYRDALRNLPADARVYSNLGSDIKTAMQEAVLRQRNPSATIPSLVGHGPAHPSGPTGVKGTRTTKHRLGPLAAPASSTPGGGGGLPTSILVLGGVAIALTAAGAAGTGWRYVRRRGSV